VYISFEMKNNIPQEDLEFFKQHQKVVEEIFDKIDEDWLNERGITSLTVIAEKTLTPAFKIKYGCGTEEIINGYEAMASKLKEIK
jgi:hypothetical protein